MVYWAEMALEERARSCLLRFRHKLEQDIKPSDLMDHMISDGVLSVDEEERISTLVSLFLNHMIAVFFLVSPLCSLWYLKCSTKTFEVSKMSPEYYVL